MTIVSTLVAINNHMEAFKATQYSYNCNFEVAWSSSYSYLVHNSFTLNKDHFNLEYQVERISIKGSIVQPFVAACQVVACMACKYSS